MPSRNSFPLAFIIVALLCGCQPIFSKAPAAAPLVFHTDAPLPALTASFTPDLPIQSVEKQTQVASPTPKWTPALTENSTPTAKFNSMPAPTQPPLTQILDPADWHHWPVIPVVSEYARQVYQLGQTLGNDPRAFSVFGDCQSEPNVFLGIYETDAQAIAALPLNLKETVAWFSGSFNRLSPTVRGGTTAGALLWDGWTQNQEKCTIYETPLKCELRIHKPSFVIIHVGTHYENRNEDYMRTILDQLIAAGVVPILASKADDRELDEHVNTQYALLAVEYDIPFWNFWAAVDGLPNRGLYTRPDATYQGDLYLTDEAAGIQRLSGLQVLDVVRRAVIEP
jgi:hypothetical protein